MKWSFSLQFQSIKRESEYNMKELSQNKWVRAAIPALLLHCSIGTVYCWSIFSQEIADYIGFSKGATEWAFSFAIFFLGMSAAFLGNIVEKDIHKSSLTLRSALQQVWPVPVSLSGTAAHIREVSYLCWASMYAMASSWESVLAPVIFLP